MKCTDNVCSHKLKKTAIEQINVLTFHLHIKYAISEF